MKEDTRSLYRRLILFQNLKISIIGFGYVGQKLAESILLSDLDKLNSYVFFDVDQEKIERLKNFEGFVENIDLEVFRKKKQKILFTNQETSLRDSDVFIVAVPTPLRDDLSPNLEFVESAFSLTKKAILSSKEKSEFLIVNESTVYPSATKKIFEKTFLESERNFIRKIYLSYSPERIDPSSRLKVRDITKIISATDTESLRIVEAFYSNFVKELIAVSSIEIAEAAKLVENVYRAVNISLVNELKILFDRLGLDVFEIIRAAATKPFGFQPFWPSPGMGGHCIPIDPLYLSYVARLNSLSCRFIDEATIVNRERVVNFVIEKILRGFSKIQKPISEIETLFVGASYKKNISDTRQSPLRPLLEQISSYTKKVSILDPHVEEFEGKKCLKEIDKDYDIVVIVTDHDSIDYQELYERAKVIVDCRGRYRIDEKVIRA